MAEYANRWPYDENEPEAPDEERCQFEVTERRRCGLGRHDDHDRCIFHLPEDAPRPDGLQLRFALEKAVGRRAVLYGAHLPGALLPLADLREARLQGANLRAANLVMADLRDTSLSGSKLQEANLCRARLGGTELVGADMQGAELAWATMANGTDLAGATLDGVGLSHATISPDTNLWLADWGARNRCKEEDEADDALSEGERAAACLGYGHAEEAYRQIKLSYQQSGVYDRAGDFFMREMECKRKRAAHVWRLFEETAKQRAALRDWVWLSLLRFLCGYGERPWYTALVTLMVFIAFTFIHAFLGIYPTDGGSGTPQVAASSEGSQTDEESVVNLDWAWKLPGREEARALSTAAYFSIVTLTSLGYGDLRPAPRWGRVAAGAEVVLGVFLLALFLLCFARKFQR